jgi:hypothetical protein
LSLSAIDLTDWTRRNQEFSSHTTSFSCSEMAPQPAPLPLIGAGLTFELLTSLEQTDFLVRKIVIAARSVHVIDAAAPLQGSMLIAYLDYCVLQDRRSAADC